MNQNIQLLLDLQVIDQQRLTHQRAREAKLKKLADAEGLWKAAVAASTTAQGEVDRLGALIRQYISDVERCDKAVVDLRTKQPEAKTNKEYMDLINGIESAKLEKVKREASLKELQLRVTELTTKAAAALAKAEQLKKAHDDLLPTCESAKVLTPEETQLQAQYAELRSQVKDEFLETYERLVKARVKAPLLRVDPTTRATPFGTLISPNHIEQMRAGKLVIDRTTNAILYIA